ncbi:MAG: hypothetical protein ACK5Z5_03050 [Neisseriaceae bacterium]
MENRNIHYPFCDRTYYQTKTEEKKQIINELYEIVRKVNLFQTNNESTYKEAKNHIIENFIILEVCDSYSSNVMSVNLQEALVILVMCDKDEACLYILKDDIIKVLEDLRENLPHDQKSIIDAYMHDNVLEFDITQGAENYNKTITNKSVKLDRYYEEKMEDFSRNCGLLQSQLNREEFIVGFKNSSLTNYLRKYVLKGLLTSEQVDQLTPHHIYTFNDSAVQKYIKKKIITIDQALELTLDQIFILNLVKVQQWIDNQEKETNDLINTSIEEIYDLIMSSELSENFNDQCL